MNFLAVHWGVRASAALVCGGRLCGVVSEERFSGIKNDAAFPEKAIAWLLAHHGLAPSLIDGVALCGRRVRMQSVSLKGDVCKQKGWLQQMQAFLAQMGLAHAKLTVFDWHDCLCYAPIAFSPMKTPCLVVSAGCVGDHASAQIAAWDGQVLNVLARLPVSLSWGYFYARASAFLGFKGVEEDGKVMGLSAYRPRDAFEAVYARLFQDFVAFDDKDPFGFTFKIDARHMGTYLLDAARALRFDDVAAALQYAFETFITSWLTRVLKHTGFKHLALNGEVFKNVKLNQKLRARLPVQSLFFMPSAGEETSVLGAAFMLARGNLTPVEMLYQGPAFSDEEIARFLKEHPQKDAFHARYIDDVDEHVAGLLARGEVVGRFAGAAEFGARSLGHRALLAHPSQSDAFYRLNHVIKQRDFWMPFAPAVLDQDAAAYMALPPDFPLTQGGFMIETFATTPSGSKALAACIHPKDGSVRAQIVTPEADGRFYALIEAFKAKTGIGAVLNTSLNKHGAPLATNPAQALDVFLETDLRTLALEHWVLEKI
ncbi:MAG: hypothetical protein FWF24_05120 [Alphaproteobacteria bacterium]|nr:hypothetical protein [Alphaproteobacteria bacterium]